MKNKIFWFIAMFSLVFMTFSNKNVFANSNLLYKESTVQTITSGVTYEKSQRLYKSGWKDIYVLTIDVNNSNVEIEVLESTTEYGLKKTTETLAIENGAIAAINGDFFGSGQPLSSMGQVIGQGGEYEAQNYYNYSENKYAGVFLDTFGNVFVDYMQSNIRLYNSKVNLDLGAKNKITDFSKPVIFDTTAITSTVDLDKRNANLFKVVVENGVITQKIGAGITANVPENGYIIVMNEATAAENLAKFEVGDSITFTESYKFVFRPDKSISEIVVGMSAGGEILRNGEVISQGMSISPNSRQPRTAVGVSQDKSKLILMVVDGRGTSVGATHNEMAELLIEYGAYDAIHFDGGGSSTIVVREEGDTNVSLVNNVSDSSQRLIPNALGVKTANPTGQLDLLKMEVNLTSGQPIMVGGVYGVNVNGFDENLNPVSIDSSQVTLYFDNEEEGTTSGLYFTPSKAGDIKLKAVYSSGDVCELIINVKEEMIGLKLKADSTSLNIGEMTTFSANGVNGDGYEMYIDPTKIIWSVDDESIGTVSGNVFTAKSSGIATITATYGSYTASITIAVGNSEVLVEDFESAKQMFMMYFPENSGVSGGVAISNVAAKGNGSLALSYSFPVNTSSSQASYVCFENSPIILSGEPSAISMMIKGDSSGNMLKAVIKDSNNNQYTITFIESMNSSDWVTVQAAVPSGVSYPIRIDKIYVGTYATSVKKQGTVYIDNISSVIKRTDGGQLIGGFVDPLISSLSNTAPADNQEDITIFGQTANKPYSNSLQVLKDAITAMKQNTTSMLFVGDSDLSGIPTDIATLQWQNKYVTSETKYLSIINLATSSGNMLAENSDQWRWFQSYLYDFSKENIIINMDKNIWDSSNGLTGDRENELFHKILKQFFEDTGKNVIVVSAVGNVSEVFVKDGIRYVTLNGLTNDNWGDLTNYKYLRVRVSQDELQYEICNVYN